MHLQNTYDEFDYQIHQQFNNKLSICLAKKILSNIKLLNIKI